MLAEVAQLLGDYRVDAGEPALLVDQDDWWNGPPADPAGIIQLIKERRTATLREAVERLGWGRVGDYFLKFSPRSYLWVSGITTILAVPATWVLPEINQPASIGDPSAVTTRGSVCALARAIL